MNVSFDVYRLHRYRVTDERDDILNQSINQNIKLQCAHKFITLGALPWAHEVIFFAAQDQQQELPPHHRPPAYVPLP